jgi:hypothetical protein
LLHNPLFVLRHGRRMLAHTFTGSSLRSFLGLESESAVFERFRASRRAERDYVRLEPSPSGASGGARSPIQQAY